ncbi:MAG: MarR family transcriptional regulator [Ruminococcaceae bacterium]|nr:MarR family transcriptional regulator [Oscillospiraceae bacterium]
MSAMMDTSDFKVARDFLNFMVDYYALIRRHEIETNEYRANSHGFSMLYALRKYQNQPITMTRFADEMGITKQQLTKLVNDLEDKEYVIRTHNRENRRQVYISITEQGMAYLETMIGELIHEVLRVMQYFSQEEKEKVGQSVVTLSEIFRKDAEFCRQEREKN